MQNTISEHTTCQTLKQMGYSSRRPHRVPLLSAKNRKRMLQFVQAQQNWTIKDWKNAAWSDESRFLLSSDATSSRIMHHVTKLKSSQTGFLNMTMSSLYSNSLHSHQISIQWSTFGMWWNGRFASWMCRRQICNNCVMLSCQYGPKSLRNVSNTLLNLCHEELRQFWRQKGVQPCLLLGTSKVSLIKWPVSVVCACSIL